VETGARNQPPFHRDTDYYLILDIISRYILSLLDILEYSTLLVVPDRRRNNIEKVFRIREIIYVDNTEIISLLSLRE
jgi:hypothetical protein